MRKVVSVELLIQVEMVEVLVVVVVVCLAIRGPYASPSQARSVRIAVHGVAWPHNVSRASVRVVGQGDWSGSGEGATVGID